MFQKLFEKSKRSNAFLLCTVNSRDLNNEVRIQTFWVVQHISIILKETQRDEDFANVAKFLYGISIIKGT